VAGNPWGQSAEDVLELSSSGPASRCYFNADRKLPKCPLLDLLVGVLLEHLLKKILFYHRYNEFTDELTHAHTPELCLER
jgi:hypothetical protein